MIKNEPKECLSEEQLVSVAGGLDQDGDCCPQCGSKNYSREWFASGTWCECKDCGYCWTK